MGKASRRKKDLVPTTVKGRIEIIRILKYMGINVLIRRFDGILFEYIVVINDNFYSDHMIFTPKVGRKSLDDLEVNHATQLILAGAFTTIEYILGVKQSEGEKAKAEEFIKVGEQAFGDKAAQS